MKVIQSVVFHKDKAFLVSTIERESSAAACPEYRYNETIVWEYDNAPARGNIVGMDEDHLGSLKTHFVICVGLFKTGSVP